MYIYVELEEEGMLKDKALRAFCDAVMAHERYVKQLDLKNHKKEIDSKKRECVKLNIPLKELNRIEAEVRKEQE